MSSSPTATLVGRVMAAMSWGTLMLEGCAVKAQSIRGRGSDDEEGEE